MPRRLSVLAGSGALVTHVVDAAVAAGDTVQVVAFAPQLRRPDISLVEGNIADPVKVIEAIARFGSTHVVLAGGLTISDRQRETLDSFAAGAATGLGDAALSGITAVIEANSGARVIGVHEIAADLLSPSGHVAGPLATDGLHEVARQALAAAREIGRLDLGQAVVTAGTRILAAEDVGGTDELLARVAAHRAAGRVGDGSGSLVLAKAAKPQQPLHVDLPAIGPTTIVNAAAAGVRLVAVEAGKSLLLDRAALVAAAERLAVTVVGLTIDG